jgi:hypothetical protein
MNTAGQEYEHRKYAPVEGGDFVAFENTNLLGSAVVVIEGGLQEPLTHTKNRSIVEEYIYPCCNIATLELTEKEIRHFHSLRKLVNEPFDISNEQHNKMIRGLWEEFMYVFGTKDMIDDIPNDRWKDFGFQNKDPRSDIRGGGVISIENLTNYLQSNKEWVKKMCKDENNFLFAITSINVSHYLKRYFHLANSLVYDRDKKEIGSRRVLKTFCSLLVDNIDLFSEVHNLLLTRIFQIWVRMIKNDPKTTLMDFGKAMDTMKKEFVAIGNSGQFSSINELIKIYRQLQQ